MSYQDTSGEYGKVTVADAAQFIRLVDGLQQDEIGAISLYSKIISSLPSWAEEIRSILEEIRRDELNHKGKLQFILELYSPNEDTEAYDKGDNNKDVK